MRSVEADADNSDKTECSHVDKPSTGMFALSDCSCIVRVGILPGLNWFCRAQWVKPGLNRIKPGLSGQKWVQHNNVHYISSTFFPSVPVCSKQYSVLYLIFHSITYP